MDPKTAMRVGISPAPTLTSLFLSPRNITLLHYLITIVEKKYPKVLRLHEELRDIPQAAKVK